MVAAARKAYVAGEATAGDPAEMHRPDDPLNDPGHGPINDPEPAELNERQHWFLAQVSEGSRCGASEIVPMWQVSLKIARRDIALLKPVGLIP